MFSDAILSLILPHKASISLAGDQGAHNVDAVAVVQERKLQRIVEEVFIIIAPLRQPQSALARRDQRIQRQ